MREFGHTTTKIAAWNLAGFNPISDAKLKKQVEGLAILDAEVVTLVEVKPFAHMQKLIDGLAGKGCVYDSVMLPQTSDLNIGVLFKPFQSSSLWQRAQCSSNMASGSNDDCST